jgi:hypothetical protein
MLVRSLFAAAVFATAAGCGAPKSKEPDDVITGSVSLDGQPVNGTVMFFAVDGREYPGAISEDGKYKVLNAPKGDGRFLVKSNLPSLPAGAPKPKDAPPPPDNAGNGKQPPAKYAFAANAIKYSYAGGKQNFDIELKP